MREMKDSGIEWVGQIPETWETIKIDSLYSVRNTKVSDFDYPPLSVTMQGIMPQLDTAAKTNDHNNRKLVKKGDFAINSRSDRRGSCGISDLDGSVSLINTVLKPNRIMNSRYYNWLFHTSLFADEFYKWGHGIVDDLWTTNWQDMKKISVPYPDIRIQELIADFLDAKCSEIDALTADIEKQIETLEAYKKSVITEAVTKGLNPDVEMKDSGIEWIGQIPKTWKTVKIGYVTKSITDLDHFMPNDYDENDGIPYLMIGDLQNRTSMIDFSKSKHISLVDYKRLSRKSKTQQGDIIFARYASIGTVSYVDGDNSFVVSYACLTVRPNELILGEFLFYYFKSYAFLEDVSQYINTNTQGNVGKESLVRAKIVLPTIFEQKNIVNFLNQKLHEIEKAIDVKKEQLDVLADYKKSLIYEYVIGKKEVPNE